MKIKEVKFRLKDGREGLLRSPEEADIPAVLDYLFVSAGESEFLLRYPEECDKYTYEGEKALFERVNASESEAFLLCFVEGKLAGTSQVMFNTHIKTRHRARVAMGILKAFWNMGVGTAMLQEMIEIAKSHQYVRQIELEFIEGNVRARALYEKMGFQIVSVHPDAIRLKDGTFLNEYAMVKYLEKRK